MVRGLLLESLKPKFIILSTELGSRGLLPDRPIKDVAYRMSKAAINFFVAKLHQEEPKLIAFLIHWVSTKAYATQAEQLIARKWVKTPLGNSIAATLVMQEAPTTEEQSAPGIFEQMR